MLTQTPQPTQTPFARIALTPAMQGILSALLRAVIDRRDELNDACDEDEAFTPHICTGCRGTGYILIPIDEGDTLTDISDASDDDVPPPTLDYDHVNHVANPEETGRSPIALAPVTPSASVNVTAGPTASGHNGAATVSEVASLLANLMRRRGVQPAETIYRTPNAKSSPAAAPAIASVSGSGVTTVSPGPAVVQSPSTIPASTVPAPASGGTSGVHGGIVPPVVAQVAWPDVVPPAITPIPGFLSLGPHATPPNVDNANFVQPGSTRFYTVTRGIRVGVFGGWSNTSPYVTGVAAAAYIRHRTLHEALEEYHSAYVLGFVRYL